jgi:hypothetical protein
MNQKFAIQKMPNSKGAAIFQKMLHDKVTISEHLKKGGKIRDIKDKFHFVKTVSIKGN